MSLSDTTEDSLSNKFNKARNMYEEVGDFFNLGTIVSWGLSGVTYEYTQPSPLNLGTFTLPYSVVLRLDEKMLEIKSEYSELMDMLNEA